MSRPAGIGLVRFVMLMGAVTIAVMLFAAPPQSRPQATHAESTGVRETIEVTVASGPGYGSMIIPAELEPEMTAALEAAAVDTANGPRAYWTSKSAEVRIGPGDAYSVIGQLPNSARLQIVGRDATSKWIAIVFAPFTDLNGWIEASAVAGQLDSASLDVAPITQLKLESPPSTVPAMRRR